MPKPEDALTPIRRLYFRTTRATIERDIERAVQLLKSLERDEDRERARAYMDGLSQMRSEWRRRREPRKHEHTNKAAPSAKATGTAAQGRRKT
jgi:hypothetical protein